MTNLSIKRIGLLIKSDLMLHAKKLLPLFFAVFSISLLLLIFNISLANHDGIESTFFLLYYVLFCAIVCFFSYRKLHKSSGIAGQLVPASNEERFLSCIAELILCFLSFLFVYYITVFVYNYLYQMEIINYVHGVGIESFKNSRTDVYFTESGLLLPNMKGILFKKITTTPLLIATALYCFYSSIKSKGITTLFFMLLLFPLAIMLLKDLSYPILNMISKTSEIHESYSAFTELRTKKAIGFLFSVHYAERSDVSYLFNFQRIVSLLFYSSSAILLISSYYAYREKELK